MEMDDPKRGIMNLSTNKVHTSAEQVEEERQARKADPEIEDYTICDDPC